MPNDLDYIIDYKNNSNKLLNKKLRYYIFIFYNHYYKRYRMELNKKISSEVINMSQSSVKSDSVPLKQIMRDIEIKTEEKVKTIGPGSGSIEDLTNIMSQSSNEFKQKTGRNMTYAEMREMFG